MKLKLMQLVLNKMLIKAVRKDNVKKAYRLIKIGADVNHEATVTTYHGQDWDDLAWYDKPISRISLSPLDFATSELMRRLLTGFGALPSEEIRKIREKERQDKKRKEALARQESLVRKQEEDTRFVDRVLQDQRLPHQQKRSSF